MSNSDIFSRDHKPVSVVFAGAGNIASQHIAALKKIEGVKVSGIYDINYETCLKKSSELNVVGYSNLDELLDKTKPDGVYLCLPPFAHGIAEYACISRKIPFFIEKPLSNNLVLAKDIGYKVRENNIITSAGYMLRYNKGVLAAKEAITRSRISAGIGNWFFERPQNHPWITKQALSGGQLLEQTTHIFDIVRYLCGDVISVSASQIMPKSYSDNNDDVAESTNVCMTTKSGSIITVMSSWTPNSKRDVRLNLIGPNISVDFTGWEFKTRIVDSIKETYVIHPDNIFTTQSRAFIKAIRTGCIDAIKSTYADAIKSLEISFAAYNSIQSGKIVFLDDDIKNSSKQVPQ